MRPLLCCYILLLTVCAGNYSSRGTQLDVVNEQRRRKLLARRTYQRLVEVLGNNIEYTQSVLGRLRWVGIDGNNNAWLNPSNRALVQDCSMNNSSENGWCWQYSEKAH